MNILENIPYSDKGMGRRKILDEKHLFIMQIALKPNQSVPQHKANSNVNLLMLEGSISVELNGVETFIKKGDLLPVKFKTPMLIKNKGDDNASFLVIKTPNPSEMK